MHFTQERLVTEALANPRLRNHLVNKGTMYLYCDYAGFASSNVYGVACCMVHDRTVRVTAKKLPIEQDQGSNYGEMMAIILSLQSIAAALTERQPKVAVIWTDCCRISRILTQSRFMHQHDEQGRNELLDAISNLNRLFPQVDVQIKYIGKLKKNNGFHRLAHLAARGAAAE